MTVTDLTQDSRQAVAGQRVPRLPGPQRARHRARGRRRRARRRGRALRARAGARASRRCPRTSWSTRSPTSGGAWARSRIASSARRRRSSRSPASPAPTARRPRPTCSRRRRTRSAARAPTSAPSASAARARSPAAGLTTPDCVSVHRRLAEARDCGAQAMAVEVSSHALDQGRVDAVRFDTAVFTNLTRDHLDYHGTIEAYFDAKARLFRAPGLRRAVVNVRDEFGRRIADALDPSVEPVFFSTSNDVWAPRGRRLDPPAGTARDHRRAHAARREQLGRGHAALAAGRRVQCREPARGARRAARLEGPAAARARGARDLRAAARAHGGLRRRGPAARARRLRPLARRARQGARRGARARARPRPLRVRLRRRPRSRASAR